MRRRKDRGFTLIELMVVVTILGILASLTSVAVMRYLKQARADSTKVQIRAIMDGIRGYQIKRGKLPERLDELIGADGVDGGEGEDADITKEDITNPKNEDEK